MTLRERLISIAAKRPPDFVIGGRDRPYLRRWFLIPRNAFFNVYLHKFMRDDDDRALHDHPWLFNASWLLKGSYIEHTIKAGGISARTRLDAGSFKFRWGAAPHRVELLSNIFYHTLEIPCYLTGGVIERRCQVHYPIHAWTLFITGPRIREWGFHCTERGWVHWKAFTAADDPGATGAGCDA